MLRMLIPFNDVPPRSVHTYIYIYMEDTGMTHGLCLLSRTEMNNHVAFDALAFHNNKDVIHLEAQRGRSPVPHRSTGAALVALDGGNHGLQRSCSTVLLTLFHRGNSKQLQPLLEQEADPGVGRSRGLSSAGSSDRLLYRRRFDGCVCLRSD